ncbi:MAG: SDR family oxidoreductase [Bryobacteraceae bacterium]|nr:SDR family oxidoreductase [Bryobacteraceae bacterium]
MSDDCLRRIEDAGQEHWGRHILLFGPTGFVGSHLLHRLLRRPETERVYAIVRPRAGFSGWDRIAATLRKYEMLDSFENRGKLTLLDGDFSAVSFGLTGDTFDRLASQVDTVIQSAGSTDYLPPYAELRRDWVLGLLGAMQFCFEGRAKQLVYLGSTIAHLFQTREDFQRPDSWWYSGYAQMKWVNQRMMASLARQGMRAQVCEAPYVLGSMDVGLDPGYVYSFWRGVAFSAALGVGWDGPLPAFVAVNVLVDAVLENAFSSHPLPVIRPVSSNDLRNADVAAHLDCTTLPWLEFQARISEHATAEQLRIMPPDFPELVGKGNLPAIFPPGYKVPLHPRPDELFKLYLTKIGLIRGESAVAAPN